MNILVVEDDAIILKRLEHFLEKWGHRVISAHNGLEALEKFLSEEVDLIITDWMMRENLYLVEAPGWMILTIWPTMYIPDRSMIIRMSYIRSNPIRATIYRWDSGSGK